ncbi:MAG TPA: cytochrome C oxidase subunit IV family protein [Methylomirabilota bacterium]|jgi:cytochrome c oxidase subunit IV|nr:cytochrome C oxidase subunit IV family protein [Methylomirabilota bacterium]
MASDTHSHPNYMAIFWILAVLTVIEIAVVFLPFGKLVNGTMLCGLAVGKAALVAMYFMHLRFETRTLGLIAITPLIIATLLVFVILPDAFHVDHKTANLKPAPAGAKH